MTDMQTPLFLITGSARSGTNMLRGFLDAHPEVLVATEFPFIPLYEPLFHHKAAFTESDVELFLSWIQKDIRYEFWSLKRWRVDINDLRSALRNKVSEGLDYADACRMVISMFRSVFPKTQIRAIVLKEPAYALQVTQLMNILPEIKVIHLYRDPRAQVNSIISMPFGSRLVSANALHWNKVQKSLVRLANEMPGKVMPLCYESMVHSTSTSLLQVCDFLGIAFQPEMMQYYEQKEVLKKVYGLDKEAIVSLGTSSLLPPDPDKITQWQQSLKSRQVRRIEAVCKSTMKKLGYQPVQKYHFISWPLFIPLLIHASIQRMLGILFRLLPFTFRLKLMFSPSLFENTYGRLFGQSKRRK